MPGDVKGYKGLKNKIKTPWRRPNYWALSLSTFRDQKGFRRSITGRLRLALDYPLKMAFKTFHDLGKPTPVKGFDDQRSLRFEVHQRKFKG
jgi:hypothetical protein